MQRLSAYENTPLGVWRHYKGGLYRLLSVGRHSETLEPVAVYQALYGKKEIWVRPMSMWEEPVDLDGVSVARFTYLGEE